MIWCHHHLPPLILPFPPLILTLRSTTLGTLMGVTLQAITFRAASQRLQPENSVSVAPGDRKNRKPKRIRAVAVRQKRRWWMLCRNDGDARRASLGEFLAVERRFGDGGAAAELEEGIVLGQPRNGRALFAEGRVLPPVEVVEGSSPTATAGLCRFSAVVAVERWCSMCSV